MQFTTPIPIEKQPVSISHDNRIMLVGSCFTENIGNRLEYYGFQTLVNPFGILYNPVSIGRCLEMVAANTSVDEDNLVQGNGLWHSWLHHGRFSHPDKATCLQNCNDAIREAHDFLLHTDTVILTLGTAFVYELENGIVAANCHKMPGNTFRKRLTTVEELSDYYQRVIGTLKSLRNDIRIIFTVSPIRHWKDGYRQNTLSKATLHLLVEELQRSTDNVFYFPVYEIVMDELRDYRFYDTDLLHPSPTTVEYIWEKFSDAYFDDATKVLCQKVAQWRKMSQHRPLFVQSTTYQDFTKKVKQLEQELKEKLPHLT